MDAAVVRERRVVAAMEVDATASVAARGPAVASRAPALAGTSVGEMVQRVDRWIVSTRSTIDARGQLVQQPLNVVVTRAAVLPLPAVLSTTSSPLTHPIA